MSWYLVTRRGTVRHLRAWAYRSEEHQPWRGAGLGRHVPLCGRDRGRHWSLLPADQAPKRMCSDCLAELDRLNEAVTA